MNINKAGSDVGFFFLKLGLSSLITEKWWRTPFYKLPSADNLQLIVIISLFIIQIKIHKLNIHDALPQIEAWGGKSGSDQCWRDEIMKRRMIRMQQ